MTKAEIVKIILYALCTVVCALKAMSYIALTYDPWQTVWGLTICMAGFLASTYLLCRVLAHLMLRLERRPKG